MRKIFSYAILLLFIIVIILASMYIKNPKEIYKYEVVVLQSSDYKGIPVGIFKGPALMPGCSINLTEDFITDVGGLIEGGHKEAYDEIKKALSIDIETELTIISKKDTILINEMTEGGEYNGGYVGKFAHFVDYKVQIGYTYPVYSDRTVGENKFFIAYQPANIWLGLKSIGPHNPVIRDPEE